jgi:N-methylhydantoinase A
MQFQMTSYVGVDVGGTFTDLVAWRPGERPVAVKVPTTMNNQANAVGDALQRALSVGRLDGVADVLHGTTVGTNAVLERKGARAALVTTKGFRDVLELGRRTRPDVYGLRAGFQPHIPRWHRFEIDERIGHDGSVIRPVSRRDLDEVCDTLQLEEIESVAVVFLHSYANATHERAVSTELRRRFPSIPISTSAEVLPEIREFERTVATALNAYLEPVLSRYMKTLEHEVRRLAPRSAVRIMQGNGGSRPVADAVSLPVRTILSGPAAGVTGAARVAAELGLTDCITCDMGGTSFDVGVIENGRPVMTTDLELEYNVPLRLPTLEIKTIGAGGGSIAWLDAGGVLRVGPHSMGATPGPIWYGRGGNRLTVTDANVIAGRLRAGSLGSDLRPTLSAEQIWDTAQSDAGVRGLGADAITAAASIISVATANMAALVRDVTIRRGRDPRSYALIAFGGAGPLHGVEIARELGIRRVVIPNAPGLLSAYGCIVADFVADAIVTTSCFLDECDPNRLANVLQPGCASTLSTVAAYRGHDPQLRLMYECHFQRQSHSLFVEGRLGASRDELCSLFLEAYRRQYGDLTPSDRIVLRSVRIEGRSRRRGLEEISLGDVWVGFEHARLDEGALWRPQMSEGHVIAGPASIGAPDASIYLPPGAVASVAQHGHIVVSP